MYLSSYANALFLLLFFFHSMKHEMFAFHNTSDNISNPFNKFHSLNYESNSLLRINCECDCRCDELVSWHFLNQSDKKWLKEILTKFLILYNVYYGKIKGFSFSLKATAHVSCQIPEKSRESEYFSLREWESECTADSWYFSEKYP